MAPRKRKSYPKQSSDSKAHPNSSPSRTRQNHVSQSPTHRPGSQPYTPPRSIQRIFGSRDGSSSRSGVGMSLPGLGLEEPGQEDGYGGSNQTIQYDLKKESEWRFEVALERSVNVKVITGTAEIFGTELVVGHVYTFIATKAAVYSWLGCTIEVTSDHGQLSTALTSEYVAEETPMHEYINTHFALETMRENLQKQQLTGPRLLILGPENSGKSSLAKTLTAYGNRSGRSPVVVNIDPAEGVLSLPGTMTATVFKTLIEVEDGWGNAPMSGPNGEIPVKLPLVYYYGSMSPDEKGGSVYKAQVGRTALAVAGRLVQDADARASGIIIDTPGSLVNAKAAAGGYDIISHIVSEFAINAIICLGSERVYSDVVKKFDGKPTSSGKQITGSNGQESEKIAVIKLTRSGGVAERDDNYMRAVRDLQVKSYFYGNPRVGAGIALQPRQQQVDFSTITVWRRISATGAAASYAGGGAGLDDDDTFLPGGIDEDDFAPGQKSTSSVPLPASQIFERMTAPTPAMRNCVLAVLNCEPEPDASTQQNVLRDSSVMGFLYVTDIDEGKGRISLLSPVAGRVPTRALIWGEGIGGVLGIT